jgi:hypothetical protein
LVLAAIAFAYWKFGDYIFFWNHLSIKFGWKYDEDTSPPPPSSDYDGEVFNYLTAKDNSVDDSKVFGYLTGR